MQSTGKLHNQSQPRFTDKLDAQTFEAYGIIDDRAINGPLPISLARIYYEKQKSLHWALVWPAYRHEDNGSVKEFGWHMVDIQKTTTAPGAKLGFRYHFKEPFSSTTKNWVLNRLADNVSMRTRGYIHSYSDAWVAPGGGNCITCICEVIKELVKDGHLPAAAVDVLRSAQMEEMKDPKKRAYHEAAAW